MGHVLSDHHPKIDSMPLRGVIFSKSRLVGYIASKFHLCVFVPIDKLMFDEKNARSTRTNRFSSEVPRSTYL